jgi:mannose-6-phosphate isomerase
VADVVGEVVAVGGVPRHYAWGSPTAIPELMGQQPDGRPVAELWFGAHPDALCPVPGGTTLNQLVAADPEGMLGADVAERFGARLPFLVKILAADKALSIQVHPDLEQARAGFVAEDVAGLSRSAPNRNYRDGNHKPELLCALTPMDALCGFRSPDDALALLAELALPELTFMEDALRQPDPLRRAFAEVLAHPDPGAAVAALTARVAEVADGPLVATRLAAEDYPADVGVLLTVLLNYVRLAPGEAIFLGAGIVHAYLRGTAVEIMANSDNVLRCGLTGKHVDISELLRIADFTALPDPRCPSAAGHFDVPVPDFRLTTLISTGSTTVRDPGPQLVLCTAGQVRVDSVEVGPGQAAFVPAGVEATVTGDGVLFIAAAGLTASARS